MTHRNLPMALACLLVATAPHAAAGQLGRLTVEISVEGAQSWKAGNDYGNAKISERYRVVTHVKSEGELSSVNVIDPDYARKQLAKAAAVQHRVAQAQGQSGAAVTAPKTPADQQAFAAKMQKEQAACGSDAQCLMALMSKYQPVLTAMSMQASGVPAADVDAVDLDAEDEARFLDFFGYEGCPTEIEMHIDNHADGAYADVGGMVPWKESYVADDRGTDIARKMQCLSQQTVYDVKDRKIYTHGFGLPTPHGRHTYWDRLHGDRMFGDAPKDTEISVNSEALSWVAEQLRLAPASGTRSTTLTPERARGGVVTAGATNSGAIKVSLKWNFEPDVAARK